MNFKELIEKEKLKFIKEVLEPIYRTEAYINYLNIVKRDDERIKSQKDKEIKQLECSINGGYGQR